MAKQKIVVKVTMSNEKKTRKALKIAVSLSGVESASFVGSEKEQIAVTGKGIDSVELTTLLRKGVGYTELVSVGPVVEKKPEAKKPAEVQLQFNPYQYNYNGYDMPYYYYVYESLDFEISLIESYMKDDFKAVAHGIAGGKLPT